MRVEPFVLSFAMLWGGVVDAATDPGLEADREAPATAEEAAPGGLFPRGLVYPLYLADPDRPASAILWMRVTDLSIADTSDTRFHLKVGGAYGLYRWADGDGSRAWQLDLLAGMDGLFDIDTSYDNVGWDGNYGLALSRRFNPRFAARFGVLHTSSHIGDELIERTGRERIGYTREELLLGGRWAPATRWSLYAEAAYAHERRNQDLQRPWRWQTGAEYLAGDLWLRGRAGWYVALDLAVWEERDSRVDSTLQAGVSVRSGVQTWRLGIELHDGRPALGEFFRDTERYAAVGVWLEL